jgi:tetratricopeptide (TPR) repeat protein
LNQKDGNYLTSLKFYEESLGLNRNRTENFYNQALILLKLDKRESAIEKLRAALGVGDCQKMNHKIKMKLYMLLTSLDDKFEAQKLL